MMLGRRELLGGLPLAIAGSARAQAAPVQIFAAMTFRPALEKVLAAYRAAGGAAIAVYAPTPVLVRQLAGGAPADILLTADPAWMDEAEHQGLIQSGTRSNLMANELVLAGPLGSSLTGTITRDFALDALLAGGRLAMCDPDHDPAGRYAKQSLQSLGFWQTIQTHIAIAESAPAAVVMVDRMEVAAAICFQTDLYGDPHAVAIGTFPDDSHAPILYPIALARKPGSALAPAAMAFLHSPEEFSIFSSFGYTRTG